jgi:hypothetical protein
MFTKFSNAFRNALVGLTVVGAVSALTLPASAASQGSYAGFVTAAGAVTSSNPFTGVRTGIGSYTITAPQSIFSTFPVMTVTPFGINGAYVVPILDSEVCGSGTCTFKVQMLTLRGRPHDNSWVFEVSEF